MPNSVDRFLTTHTGSLPRPDDLIQMTYAKEEGKPIDKDALAARIRSSVGEVVGRQRKAGIDIVNDGEMSKPSYATYVKDRLAGFGGAGNSFVYQDLVEFPSMAKRVFGDPGRLRRKTSASSQNRAPSGSGSPSEYEMGDEACLTSMPSRPRWQITSPL